MPEAFISYDMILRDNFACFKANCLVENSQAVKCQGLDLDSLLPDQEMLMKIMVHPLQIQV